MDVQQMVEHLPYIHKFDLVSCTPTKTHDMSMVAQIA